LEQDKNTWDIVVRPKSNLYNLNLKELMRYKDLILLLVKRDIVAVYKQTVLGPLWMIVQPIFTTLVYLFTFSATAKISTDGIPPILFYLMGLTFWNYFSDSLLKTSNTFIANASVFGKVYFPRLVMPISVVISNLVKLFLQCMLLTLVYLYYLFTSNDVQFNFYAIIYIPLAVLFLGIFSLSLGVVFSAFTTKYRDLTFLLGFAVQLLMFGSCIVLPASIYGEKILSILMFNPIVPIIEAVKYFLTGHGLFSPFHLMFAFVTIILTFVIGVMVFNKTEKTFIDTV
jgi:lipopolysaccharide transport system permease protein